MDRDFWIERWQSNTLGFHEPDGNPLLAAHIDRLGIAPGARVFVPLCGKTGDIAWLLANGYEVVGVELAEAAIEQLFAELDVAPTITEVPTTSGTAELMHHAAPGLDIFVGDVFALDAALLGHVDAVYDRAAMVALPDDLRRRYSAHVRTITGAAPQLIITFLYDQSRMDGPPFSIDRSELDRHHAEVYDIVPLAAVRVPGGLKGTVDATEAAWLLTT